MLTQSFKGTDTDGKAVKGTNQVRQCLGSGWLNSARLVTRTKLRLIQSPQRPRNWPNGVRGSEGDPSKKPKGRSRYQLPIQ